jgi:hypothetical protein
VGQLDQGDRGTHRTTRRTLYGRLANLGLTAFYHDGSSGRPWHRVASRGSAGCRQRRCCCHSYEAWIVSSFRVHYTGSATTCSGAAIAVRGAPVLLLATALARNRGYLTPASLLGAAGVIGLASTRTLWPSIHDPVD